MPPSSTRTVRSPSHHCGANGPRDGGAQDEEAFDAADGARSVDDDALSRRSSSTRTWRRDVASAGSWPPDRLVADSDGWMGGGGGAEAWRLALSLLDAPCSQAPLESLVFVALPWLLPLPVPALVCPSSSQTLPADAVVSARVRLCDSERVRLLPYCCW